MDIPSCTEVVLRESGLDSAFSTLPCQRIRNRKADTRMCTRRQALWAAAFAMCH
jgi:hypothetical protein